jgi:sulfate/thiosulfate-binding protein
MGRIALAFGGTAAALLAATVAGAASQDTKLTLVAYSTPKEAFAKAIPAFQATPQGNGVGFDQSYGASGEQTRAVLNGLPADVVDLSLQPDMDQLVKAGIVSKGWSNGPYHGMVTDSVVVFVVRNGNPKHITQWSDLVRQGVDVITPNPFTSGGARWNVMAAYGAQLKTGHKASAAQDYLLELFKNVSVQDKSARDALNTFLGGKGDVLLTYENEAILAQKKGQPVYFVIPRATILIENPIAITNGKNQGAARNFLRFLYGATAQTIFGENGYRPVVKSVAANFKYPPRPGLFTINQLGLGGWDKVQKDFFDPSNGIMAKIERQVGGVSG